MPEAADAGSGPPPALMLFDGTCNFCNGSVMFVLARSRPEAIAFCAMQTPAGQAWLDRLGLAEAVPSTMALVADGAVHLRFAAVLRVGERMAPPWPFLARLLRRLMPPALGDRLYDVVARNRFRIAGRCAVPDAAIRARFVTDPPP